MMSDESVNGWKVLGPRTSGELPRLRKFVIPGTGRHFLLRDGAAGFVLAHMLLYWHEAIERLDVGPWDDWGWAPRPVRGGTVPSNHASGTAADANATRHPRGVPVSRTFTPRQLRLIRRAIAWRRVLTWGGSWPTPGGHGVTDGMHVELSNGVTLARVERVARWLMLTPRGRRILRANPGLKGVIES